MGSVTVVIPARWGSTRLPGKATADLGGLPLVEWVRRRALLARSVDRVIVATDHVSVASCVRDLGGEVVLTGPAPNGTARVAEVAHRLGLTRVINVQGDQPLLDPAHVDAVAKGLEGASVATAASELPAGADPADPALVKVVVDRRGRALYFSRLPIPRCGPWRLHVGIYGFAPGAIERCVVAPIEGLARSEDLEQLAWLEAGEGIGVVSVSAAAPGVDTPAQLEALRERVRTGSLVPPSIS